MEFDGINCTYLDEIERDICITQSKFSQEEKHDEENLGSIFDANFCDDIFGDNYVNPESNSTNQMDFSDNTQAILDIALDIQTGPVPNQSQYYSDISDDDNVPPAKPDNDADHVDEFANRITLVSDADVENKRRKRFAKATESKLKWAANLFSKWKSARNEKALQDPGLQLSVIHPALEEMTN